MKTVALLSTPPGEGGIAVIEVIGPGAVKAVARKFSRPMPKPGALAFGRLVDEVVVRVLPARQSPVGETTVEISCHGGTQPAEAVLCELGVARGDRQSVLDRAVAARRLDRTRAEAIALLPGALTSLAAKTLLAQAEGALARAVRRSLKGLRASARVGLALVTPPRVAIVGRANAGKSTLFNALVERERALVSPVAGTTRDPVEETIALNGFPVRLVDTAGLLPESPGLLEQLSLDRTREEIGRSDLLLLVQDATGVDSVEEGVFLKRTSNRATLRVLNKADLVAGLPPRPLAVSARMGDGLDRLRRAILRALGLKRPKAGAPVVFTERQRTLLEAFDAGAKESEVRKRLLWG